MGVREEGASNRRLYCPTLAAVTGGTDVNG